MWDDAKPKILKLFLLLLNPEVNIQIHLKDHNVTYTHKEICVKIICDENLQYNDESDADPISKELIFNIVKLIGEENMFDKKMLKKYKDITTWYTIYKDFSEIEQNLL